jgi:hypothetical protein
MTDQQVQKDHQPLKKTTGGEAATQRTVWKGWVEIDGKRMFLKSKWEKRYCLYLSFMKKHGHIVDYWYEPETFWFEGIKRGTTSYKPDFKVQFPSGNCEFYEIKGYESAKDRTKYKRMAKYHPNVKLNVVGKEWFKANSHILKRVLKDWS